MTPRLRVRPAVVCAAAALVLGSLAAARVSGLRVNTTPSMPVGLWRIAPVLAELRRGDIVTACPPEAAGTREAAARGYLAAGTCPGGYEPLVKSVAAVPGDLVTVGRTGVSVNGALLDGTAPLDRDSAGRELRAFPPGVHRVPASRVWLLSGHDARSWDSRYFGPVAIEDVQAVAHPVWVR